MVEVADFLPIREKHAITQPVKAVGQNNFALCAFFYAIQINRGHHFVSGAQIDLPLMRVGESMRLPKSHGLHYCGKESM